MWFSTKKLELPATERDALPGRDRKMTVSSKHAVLGNAMAGELPANLKRIMFGMGCFWGAERKFWELGEGIHITAVGYAGGYTPNPTYEEVCSGRTGHRIAHSSPRYPDCAV